MKKLSSENETIKVGWRMKKTSVAIILSEAERFYLEDNPGKFLAEVVFKQWLSSRTAVKSVQAIPPITGAVSSGKDDISGLDIQFDGGTKDFRENAVKKKGKGGISGQQPRNDQPPPGHPRRGGKDSS
jgi:hypothetical protein